MSSIPRAARWRPALKATTKSVPSTQLPVPLSRGSKVIYIYKYCIYIYICMYVCARICIYVCMSACMYECGLQLQLELGPTCSELQANPGPISDQAYDNLYRHTYPDPRRIQKVEPSILDPHTPRILFGSGQGSG